MADLIVDDQHIEVALSRVEQIGALRREVRFPLGSISSVRWVDVARREISGIRAPGTHWPRGIALGTWRKRGTKSFVAVRGSGPGYVIDLDGEDFDRLIIETAPIEALEGFTSER